MAGVVMDTELLKIKRCTALLLDRVVHLILMIFTFQIRRLYTQPDMFSVAEPRRDRIPVSLFADIWAVRFYFYQLENDFKEAKKFLFLK